MTKQTFSFPFGNDGWKRLKTTDQMIDMILGDMLHELDKHFPHRKAIKIARHNALEYDAAAEARRISRHLKVKLVPNELSFTVEIDNLER